MKLWGPLDDVRPKHFGDGQRVIFGCLVAFAGVAHFVFAAAVVAILVWGQLMGADWGDETRQQRLEILGWGLFLLLAIDAIVVVSLSLGGPVGRLKGKAGKDGFDFEASGDGEQVQTTVTATTTVTPVPAAPPVDPSLPQPPAGYAG
jgi:hypothetical protein